jgi:D-serine deaminase-like pyridoxal phosphate-dependent protein
LKNIAKRSTAIAQKLVEVETIERDDFEKILIANGITPKTERRYRARTARINTLRADR